MALIKCSECGKEVSNKADSCPHCGNPITKKANTKYCEYCGDKMPANAEKCPHCYSDNIPRKKEKTNICATLGLVFGLVAMFINPLALFGTAAVVLSCIGSVQIKNNGDKGTGYAIAGFILGFISIGYFVYNLMQYEEMLVTLFS